MLTQSHLLSTSIWWSYDSKCFHNTRRANQKHWSVGQSHWWRKAKPSSSMDCAWELDSKLNKCKGPKRLTWNKSSGKGLHQTQNGYYSSYLIIQTLNNISGTTGNKSSSQRVQTLLSSTCTQAKVPNTFPAGKHMSLYTPQCRWSHIGLDFTTNLWESSDNIVIQVIIRPFHQITQIWSLAVPQQALSTTCWNKVPIGVLILWYSWRCDQWSRIDSSHKYGQVSWKKNPKKLGIGVMVLLDTSLNSVEHVNQEIKHFLRTYYTNNQGDWSWFPPWRYAQEFSPAYWNVSPTILPVVDEWFRKSEQVWESMHQQLVNKQTERVNASADKSV